MISKQEQKSGDNSSNVQARDIITIGITYSYARQIAEDVFNSNFLKLSTDAANVAHERADKFIEKYLEKLQKTHPQAIESSSDPDMQYALFVAQREYARSGNDDLSDVLVDILVARANEQQRSLLQIVLNESLTTAPKLTENQFDILSLIFIIRYTVRGNLNSLDAFNQYYQSEITKFIFREIDNIKDNPNTFQHLQYAGCGATQISAASIGDIVRSPYSGLFCKGIPREEKEILTTQGIPNELFMPCFHNMSLYQFNALDEKVLREKCLLLNLSQEDTEKVIHVQRTFLFSSEEIETYMSSNIPEVKNLLTVWGNSGMKNFTLTSVGIAIAHANIKRKMNDNKSYDLSIWIN